MFMKITRPRRISTKGFFLGLALAPGLAGVAAPAVDGLVERYRLHSTAEELATQLQQARAEAVSGNVVVRVRRDGNQLVREHSADGVTFVHDSVLLTLPRGVHVTIQPEAPTGQVASAEANL